MIQLGRILFSVLTIILMAVQPVYSKVSDPAITVNPLQGQISEEGLVRLTLPSVLIEQALRDNLVANESNPDRYLKEISRFELDPIQKLLILEGLALIPQGIVNDMDAIAGGKVFTAEHKFRLIIELPSAQKLSITRFFVLKIVELNVGGLDYTSGVSRIGQFLASMLTQTSFMDWILKDPEAPMPDASADENRLSMQISHLFDSKTIMIRNQSIYLKLDFSQIQALSAYASLESFRLWNAVPVLLKGTNMSALQIEAGLGIPGENWFKAIAARGEGDAQSVENAQAELYEQLGDVVALSKEIYTYTNVTKTQLNFPIWKDIQERDLVNLKKEVSRKVREGLSLENPIFKANPQWGYDNTKEEVKSFALSRLLEMKREALAEAMILGGGVKGGQKPLLSQRVSQRAIKQGVRFARDFDFENEQLFAELEVVLAPQIPGVILRGMMNVDMNTFMELGLEGEGIDWGNRPWRLAEDRWNKALPFELSLRLHMFDNGEIGFDIRNFSVLKGSEKLNLSKNSGHGHLMVTWTKMAIVEALTTLAMQGPSEALPENQDSQNQDEDKYFKETISKIHKQVYAYSTSQRGSLDESKLLTMAEIDIAKNPFNQVGSEQVATKVRYLFEEIVRFDENTELLLFKVDPRLVAEKIYHSENNLQVWNLETIFDQGLNQTYVEASVGVGQRSKDYINDLYTREEKINSENFVSIDESKPVAPSDLITKMRFSYFENFLNKIFADASNIQLQEARSALKDDREQSYNLVRDLNIGATEDGRLKLGITFQMIEKVKKGALARLFSSDYKVTEKTAHISAIINLSVKSLEKYKSELTLAPKEVFFGEEVLSIDLENVGLKLSGDTGILDKAINLVAGGIDFKNSSIAKKAKVIVLHFLKSYLHSTDASVNGNVELAGVKINRFAKLLAHKEELLIQLNPHIMSAAFDVRSVVNDDFNGKEVGIVVSKANDSISFHFSTSGNMAAVDKGELLNIMKDSKELFDSIINGEKFSKEELLFLYDKSLYNSDYKKLSLYHRLNRVLRNYAGVNDLVKPDTAVVDAINAQIFTDFSIESGEFNSRFLSGSGVEVMYFVSAAYFLKSGLDKVIEKIEELGLDTPYLMDMKFKSQQLAERFIDPLMSIYSSKFAENNSNILSKGPTDWNYTYYSDALYCHNVFSIVAEIKKMKSFNNVNAGGRGE